MPTTFHNLFPSNMQAYEEFGTLERLVGKLDQYEYRNCQFNDIDFTGMEVSRVKFVYCRFIGCTFNNATLRDVQFHGSTISMSDLEGTQFNHVLFKQSSIEGSKGAITAINCGFDRATLYDSAFKNALFEDVRFVYSRLVESSFERAYWHDITVDTTDISDCRFVYTKWRDVRIDGNVRTSLFDHAYLENVHTADPDRVRDCNRVQCRIVRSNLFSSTAGRPFKCSVCGEMKARNYQANAEHHICRTCAHIGDYSEPNDKVVGKPTKRRLPTFSIEFEVADEPAVNASGPNPIVLVKHGFKRCHDGSVDSEYKSPIYQDSREFSRILPVLDPLAEYVDDHCGTHIHVGFSNKGRLKHHFSRIFTPLVEQMERNEEETEMFWGRYFTAYAQTMKRYSEERYVWLNLTKDSQPTIEFRLAKFVSARQYGTVVKFVRELARYLDDELAYYREPSDYDRIAQNVLSLYKKHLSTLLVAA